MLVTFLTPTLKAKRHISRRLKSVRESTLPRVQTQRLVLDGAYSENTVAIAEKATYHHALRSLARGLAIEDQVTWAGTRRDAPQILKSLNAFALRSRHEGFRRVVAEATCTGIPPFVSSEGVPPECVSLDPLGATAQPADTSSFAKGITRLLWDPSALSLVAASGASRSHFGIGLHRSSDVQSLFQFASGARRKGRLGR